MSKAFDEITEALKEVKEYREGNKELNSTIISNDLLKVEQIDDSKEKTTNL